MDADLLIAYDETLIICEAKGVGIWSRKQIAKKIEGWKKIRDLAKQCGVKLQLHVVLVSPVESENIYLDRETKVNIWPDFLKNSEGKPYFLKLPLPQKLLGVKRCHGEGVYHDGQTGSGLAGEKWRDF
ncbi:hypothetical protein [Polycladidibacter stylochi]|uniref:hypothetical protein n=1 Tax=Polycladidibacter stylochi TaxID=1807766 RepID=UPI000A70AD75|nr:hypothetical protein [Pseudovibrio stylochi]